MSLHGHRSPRLLHLWSHELGGLFPGENSCHVGGERGAALGLALGIGGAIGSFAGGALTDRYGKKDIRWYMKLPAYAVLLSVFFIAGALFLQDNLVSVICFGCVAALQSSYLGPSIAVAHSLVPASMRALTSAILFFVLNLIGQGFGPWVVGMISDRLTSSPGLRIPAMGNVDYYRRGCRRDDPVFRTARTLTPSPSPLNS